MVPKIHRFTANGRQVVTNNYDHRIAGKTALEVVNLGRIGYVHAHLY